LAASVQVRPSPGLRTAETHVENILVKLGLTSRTQVVAWVIQQRTAGRDRAPPS
jgi:non-specific serine/threonine protein kinase